MGRVSTLPGLALETSRLQTRDREAPAKREAHRRGGRCGRLPRTAKRIVPVAMADAGSSPRLPRAARRLVLGATLPFLLAGCVSETVRVVDMTPPQRLAEAMPEELLLDIGVAVFDANVPEDYDEQVERNVQPEVRRAEGNYMAFFLKNLLQSTGNWGAVRVVPHLTRAVDVVVSATIEHSDGASLALSAKVRDARGALWFEREYRSLASKYAYDGSIPQGIDPFQTAYRNLADDMLAHLRTLETDEVRAIRAVAEMQFARDFAPHAFGDYLGDAANGDVALRRLPAETDPMLARVRRIREREYLFIDTLDEHYETFSANMFAPYQNWRRATYEESIAYNQARQQARARVLAGSAAVIGGIAAQTRGEDIATRYGGLVAIIGGAGLLKTAIDKFAEAKVHAEVLQELGVSAEAEIVPHNIELENQTLSLQGTVDAQYDALRDILKRVYFEELGLAPPGEPTSDADEDVATKPDEAP